MCTSPFTQISELLVGNGIAVVSIGAAPGLNKPSPSSSTSPLFGLELTSCRKMTRALRVAVATPAGVVTVDEN